MTEDAELLLSYARAGSQEAFSKLVQRHLPAVYSAALRRLAGDAQLAEDASQRVFCALAQKARPPPGIPYYQPGFTPRPATSAPTWCGARDVERRAN